MTLEPLSAATEPVPPARGRSAALTAIGQIFVLLGASLIGVVVAASLSPGPRLDAYFNASQIAVAALYVGQALRTSVPGLVVGGVVSGAVIARAAMLATAAVGAVLLLAAVLAPLLVPEASRSALRSDLLILLPGATLQVAGGYAAGRLAMAGSFAAASIAYALGTLLNAVLLIVLIGSGGAGLLAPAALAGWLTSSVLIGVHLWRTERRRAVDAARTATPAPAGDGPVATPIGVRGAAGRIVLSVTPILASQLVIVSAGIAAASIRAGGTTLMSLAFLAINAVGTVAVAPIPIVLSADLGTTWDRRTETLVPLILSVVRLSAAVMLPFILGLILIGKPIADAALAGLSPADVDDLFMLVLVLLPSLPITAAGMVAMVAVFSLDRLGRVARIEALVAVLAAASLAMTAVAGASLTQLAIVASVWSAALGIAMLSVVLSRQTARVVSAIVAQALLVAGPALVVLAAALATGAADSLATGVAWTVAGFLVHAASLKLRHPAELAVLVGAIWR